MRGAPPPNAPEGVTAPAPPGAALLARFTRDTLALLAAAPTPERPLALAVSGGPDSMALLALAAAAFPGATIAATVDHRLRPAGAEEAAMVSAHCAALGVSHRTLVPAQPIAGASIQAAARAARYALLGAWAAPACALATAHHRDDQAETFLMRAARGSGPGGLGGIRPSMRLEEGGVTLIRPLLGWDRATLRTIAESHGPFVDDPSNADARYDRTHARQLLATTPWLDPALLAAAADHCREADAALLAITDWLWRARSQVGDGACRLDLAGVPRELRRRLVRQAVQAIRVSSGIERPAFDPYSANIEPLLDAIEAGRAATHAGVMASEQRGRWCFRPAPPRRSH
jgi:tRNA(Ile)-lysidine synthase